MFETIHILHVIGYMDRGGAENMIMNLYRNIDRTKVQFDFVENEGKETAFDAEIRELGGRIYHCPRYRGKNHFAYTRWWHTFFKEHPNEYPIVHGHIGSTAAIYLSIAKKYGAYTIAHSHNINTMKTAGDVVYSMFAYPTRFVADHFFACSREAGISRYGSKKGSCDTRCTVLPNAIDTSKFAYNEDVRQRMRKMLGIGDAQMVVGNISRFAEQKNHRFLIDIFENVHKKNPNAVLLLVGDGELRSEIENMIKEKALQDHVILTGVQSDTWNYYQVMDVFVMPSLFEGLPVSLVEAQTAGLPCCVSAAVPNEVAITGLVEFQSLSYTSESWADWVMERAKAPRHGMMAEIQQAGYDIGTTSKWLEKYYTEVVKSRG